MILKHLTEFSDEDWFAVHQIMYDKEVMHVMGAAEMQTNPMTLVSFYEYSIRAHERGLLEGWLITVRDESVGYVLLDKRNGEWELGVAIQNPENRNHGVGVRASLKVLKWAFEEDGAEWVTAFTQGNDPKVPHMIKRIGFRRLYHLWVMDKATWDERWSGRVA